MQADVTKNSPLPFLFMMNLHPTSPKITQPCYLVQPLARLYQWQGSLGSFILFGRRIPSLRLRLGGPFIGWANLEKFGGVTQGETMFQWLCDGINLF